MNMRTHIKVRISLLLAFIVAFSLLCFRAAGAPADADVAIIVNANNPVNNLTMAELRKIYLGDKQYWKGNFPVLLLMRSQGAREREVVLRVIFQMSEEAYTKHWVAKVMRAEASDPPAALFSHGMMQEGVKGNLGAIGYVNSNDVRSGVKVVHIDGLLPGERGYPMH
jgi:ABC-type phosphate transport system substrate-binding protein